MRTIPVVRIASLLFAALFTAALAPALQDKPADSDQSSQPISLTIYNQNFAVARISIDLDLHPGINEITTARVTGLLEPDSVILRDPTSHRAVSVLEQNYDAGVVNQQWLLEKFEGKTIDFQVSPGQVVSGRILRAGNGQSQPLIDVKGSMQFQLPGIPLFPSATDGLLLKPTLRWQIRSETATHIAAELAYVTGGFDWESTYNVVAPETTDVTAAERADLVGWITMHNLSGSDFPEARIKLMAGDVAKLQPYNMNMRYEMAKSRMMDAPAAMPEVTQKAFDDFHLYDLNRVVALRNGETKQVQFIDAPGVSIQRSYIYDGLAAPLQPIYSGNIYQQRGYGLDSENTHVAVIEEIKNSSANHLGMPLPAGRLRLYRRDSDGQMEFVGETTISHTPAEETLKIPTGNAFDVKGSRRQTDFHISTSEHIIDETFEIKLTNQKLQPVKVNVTEHMYRGDNWEITSKSGEFVKRDSHTLDFPVHVPSKGTATLTYTVHYTW